MAWSKKDRARAAGIVRQIATERGTLAALAGDLGLKDRAVLTNWLKRGQVPLEYIQPLLKLAPKHVAATPALLHPKGHLLEKSE